MRPSRTSGVLLAAAGLVLGSAVLCVPAHAQDRRSLETGVAQLETDAGNVTQQTLTRDGYRSQKRPEERLSDGKILLKLKSYVPASLVLSDVVENYPQHPAAPEALYYLGEALYGAGDYYGARTRFRELLAKGDQPSTRGLTSSALGRLIEIAIRTRNFDGVDEYFERLNRLPSQEVEAAATYYRAKFQYNKAVANIDLQKREGTVDASAADTALLSEARQGFEAVAESSPFYPQARYFVGVILALQGQYPKAIEAFNRVLRLPVTNNEQREVSELARLALGRLYYETDQLNQAVLTYEGVPPESKYFDAALYEIAWVHIRAKNHERAEQALATLATAAPESAYVADGIVLRGNLLLRQGELAQADDVFQQASASYGPVRDSLNAIIADHEDAEGYFRNLVREHVDDFAVGTVIPQPAVPFARDEYELERATEVMGELASVRRLVSETETIIRRFNDALAADNRANIYPDSRRLRLRTTALLNRAAHQRMNMIRYVEGKGGGSSSELASVRSERKALEKHIEKLPQSESDLVARDKEPLTHYQSLGYQLRDIQAEIYALEARIAAAERYLRESPELRQNPEAVATVQRELNSHRKAVDVYRQSLADASHVIEAGRLRVGVDDERYKADRAARQRYKELVDRELSLLRAAGIASAVEVEGVNARLGLIEAKVASHDQYIDGVLAERDAEIRRLLAVEQATVEGHRQHLASLETHSEDVVGGATYAGFSNVRQRLYDLVLRADVGGVDVRWAEREKHRINVERLTRERARVLQALDNEYNEIMGQAQGVEQ